MAILPPPRGLLENSARSIDLHCHRCLGSFARWRRSRHVEDENVPLGPFGSLGFDRWDSYVTLNSGFQDFFLGFLYPDFFGGKWVPIWGTCFSNGWLKPPTSWGWLVCLCPKKRTGPLSSLELAIHPWFQVAFADSLRDLNFQGFPHHVSYMPSTIFVHALFWGGPDFERYRYMRHPQLTWDR